MISNGRDNIYVSGEYISNNPTLDVEDSPWKLRLIQPAINRLIQENDTKYLRILDVGGGAGMLLSGVSDYLKAKDVNVEKYALDMSAEMLRIQVENNPDMSVVLEGSVEKMPIKDKEIDLVLMIDVLEHVADPAAALNELRRIAKYVIFKVPMENNLFYNFLNVIKGGRQRKNIFEKVGHLQFYNPWQLKAQLMKYAGEIIYFKFSNEFSNMLSPGYHRRLMIKEKIVFAVARTTYSISPPACSLLFPDSAICLVRCR